MAEYGTFEAKRRQRHSLPISKTSDRPLRNLLPKSTTDMPRSFANNYTNLPYIDDGFGLPLHPMKATS